MRVLTTLSFGKKILLSFALISAICIGVASLISFFITKDSFIGQTNEQMGAMTHLLKDRLEGELERARNMSERLGSERLMEGLFLAYEGAFYGGNFIAGGDLDINSIPYKNLEKIYGERVRNLALDYGVERILLVSIDAQVIFSSLSDESSKLLGRNLKNGKIKGSSLSNCYQKAFTASKSELVYSGVEFYDVLGEVGAFFCIKQLAEFDHPAEGISKGDVMGVVVTQLNLNHLNKIVSNRAGMGESGQAYLIGQDHFLRSDIALGGKEFSLSETFKSKRKIETAPVKLALEGQSGHYQGLNPMGQDVFSFYLPINALGQKWALVSEKQVDEVYAPALKMLSYIVGASLLTLVGVLVIGYVLAAKLVAPINVAGEDLSQVSKIVSEKSNAMKDNSAKLSEGSSRIAAAIQETVSVLDELTSMVNRNLENVKLSSSKSDESQEMAKQGDMSVKSMLEAMGEISRANESMVTEMSAISENMQEIISVIENIGEKTSVINDIVFQTKLLSFNASVEAARAGEQGKGFAVVAEEVGALAGASGKAASEISELLGSSVDKVNAIVENSKHKLASITKSGQEKILLGNERARECGEILKSILDNICEVDRKIKEISDASQEQSTGINEVSHAMDELEKISHTSSEISAKALEHAKGLEEQSGALENVMKNLSALVHGGGKQKTSMTIKPPPPKKIVDNSRPKVVQLKKVESNVVEMPDKSAELPESSDPRFKEI